VALRIWRDLLIVADSGQIQVRLAPQLGVADLEDLSLTSQFVLRCIAQSEYASADEIAEALNLPRGDVDAALRAALARGLIEKQDGLMRITWTWFRPITRLLTRQNLLANK
jgi:DNA-binding MarR family transcriptional regulator